MQWKLCGLLVAVIKLHSFIQSFLKVQSYLPAPFFFFPVISFIGDSAFRFSFPLIGDSAFSFSFSFSGDSTSRFSIPLTGHSTFHFSFPLTCDSAFRFSCPLTGDSAFRFPIFRFLFTLTHCPFCFPTAPTGISGTK